MEAYLRLILNGKSFMLRRGIAIFIEIDRYGTGAHTAEEIALSRSEGREVSYPTFVGREGRKMIMRLDDVTRRSIGVIIAHRFAKRDNLLVETGQFAPVSITAQDDLHRVL